MGRQHSSSTRALDRSEQLRVQASASLRQNRRAFCSWAPGSWVLAVSFVAASFTASAVPIGLGPSPGVSLDKLVCLPWFSSAACFFRRSKRRSPFVLRDFLPFHFVRSPPLTCYLL